MSYVNVYPSRINWENEPSIASPINATNLNKIDYAVYEHDQTLETWDVTKANQSDLLLSVKSIDYDTDTGVFVFTWQNGTTKTVDLNIEKIPVSFSMDANGVITMTTDDGTTYTADVGALIKTYTFTDSSEIDFTVTTDSGGNKTVTASIVAGSITGSKLEPNYLANCQNAANSASGSATAADGSAEDSEAWAVGTRDGVPVPSSDPAYENNSKYWAQHTTSSFAGLTDTDITNPQNGQVPVYNSTSQKWENADQSAGGGSKVTVTTTEASLKGKNVTITQGQTTLTEVFDNSGVAVFEGVTLTGTVTITATDGVDTATRTLEIPYFGNYTLSITLFTATITATFPASNGATCVCDGVTATTSPYTFTVGATGTYSVVCTLDGADKTSSVVITTDGQSESVSFEYGTINLSYVNDFRGLSITCTDGTTTITKTAPSGGNSMTFYPPRTGNWTISGSVGGQTYVSTPNPVVVSSLSTAVSADIQTYIVATVTLHGAVAAYISWVDVRGPQTQGLDENGVASNVVVKVDPSNPYVSFVDTNKSKLPEDLTKSYFKRVEITNALTDIYIMPDNSLYWWGYKDSRVESSTNANGWGGIVGGNTVTWQAPTYNTTYIYQKSPQNFYCQGFGTANKVTDVAKAHTIVQGVNLASGQSVYDTFALASDKSYSPTTSYGAINPDTNTMARYDLTANASPSEGMHILSYSSWACGANVYALWYDTTIPNTPTYYSAAYDMLYIKDTSNNIIPIAVTDAEGKAYDALLPNGTYTIYSSVAKNPDSLSDAYSKTVTITNATSDVYVMPDNALYWFGFKGNEFEDCTSANGWNLEGLTHYDLYMATNYINVASYSSGTAGVGYKNAITNGTTMKVIAKGNTANQYGVYGAIIGSSTKNCVNGTDAAAVTTTLSVVSCAMTQSYFSFDAPVGANSDLHAMWYE